MRWSQVLPDGTYKPAPQAQLSYATLLAGRVMITAVSTIEMKRVRPFYLYSLVSLALCDLSLQAATIAARFSAIRAPFDVPILNYQSHHARLFPIIAAGYDLSNRHTDTHLCSQLCIPLY